MAKGFGPKKKPHATKRQQAYFKLIQKLLQCSRGRELKILSKHEHLVDTGLLEMMEMVATILVAQRQFCAAEFLIDLAKLLTEELGLDSQFFTKTDPSSRAETFVRAPFFLWEALRIILLDPSDRQTPAQILARNWHELNEDFLQRFSLWIERTLLKCQPHIKEGIALPIIFFSEILWLFPLGNRAINLEILIAGLEGAAQIFTRDLEPQIWAKIQSDLAPAYRNRMLGDRSQNLEEALTACNNALQIYTRHTSLQEWATVQNNLGLVYSYRMVGKEAENLEKAIFCYEETLKVLSYEQEPQLWGTLQNNLALAYTRRVEGDRAQNLEKAIACYQVALKVRTDSDWASSQFHLGLAYRERILGDKIQNQELAIAAYQAALQVYNPEENLERRAKTQFELGNTYHKLGRIAEAVTCFQAALKVFRPTSFPRYCIDTGIELGKIALATGDKAKAFEYFAIVIEAVDWLDRRRVSTYLDVETLEIFPTYLQIVTLCLIFGERKKAREYAERSNSNLILGLLQDIQVQQITLLGQFLIRALQTAVETENNPQTFYQLLQENIEQLNDNLVERLNAMRLLLSDPSAHSKLGPAEAIHLAAAVLRFSSLIKDFDKGDEENNWNIAKAGYEVAATVFNEEQFPDEWDFIQREIRSHLIFKILQTFSQNQREFKTVDRLLERNLHELDEPDDRELREVNLLLEANKEQLDEYFIKALRDLSSSLLSEIPAEGKKEIAVGIIYLSLCIQEFQQENRSNHLEIAIAGYEIATTALTRESTPKAWASCQMFLGRAYCLRFKGDRADNLEQAIACCQDALQIYTHEAFPIEWASIQNTLALALDNRIRGDRLENAELALAACEAAMKVFTRDGDPGGWAQVQNNLGIIYRDRICGDRAESLEQAIACYENALLFRTREDFPQEWAQTQMNLASAYRQRIYGDPVANVEKAIATNLEALQVYTQDAFPANWAGVQINLANAYLHRPKGDRKENLEMAVVAYQAALKIFNRDEFPQEWALAQINLGNCYSSLERNEEAIACYQLALTEFTPKAFPVDCQKAGIMLGDTAFVTGDWNLAIEGYGMAIEAVETSRTWATSEFRRQEILEEAIDMYANIVQACINNKQLDKALEYVERARSQRLIDLIASNDLYSSAEIPAEIQEDLQEFEQLQQQIDRERDREQPDRDPNNSKLENSRAALEAYNQTIATLEANKLLIWEQIRRLDPVLAGQIRVNPLTFSSIQQLIDKPNTAILSFYTTASDTFIFVVRQNEIALQRCAHVGIEALHGWILQDWLGEYIKNTSSWKEQKLVEILAKLAKQLSLTDLILWHLEGISELIIIPHLTLHQIPFAALPIGDNQYLGDRFLIRYAPSCQVLEFCQRRPSLDNDLNCGIIEDATEDLPFASFEGERLAALYRIPDNQHLRGRSQATVSKYRELARTVPILHASHHAQSRLDNPLESILILGDGCITLGQLMTPAWRLPQLSEVFLSCCETGLSITEMTGDLLTFSTAFLSAGARTVISTLWSVDDLATALFSIFYHQKRHQGRNRPEAIRQAQIQMRELTGDTLAASYKFQLIEALKQKLKAVQELRQRLRTQRDIYPVGSPDYEQWNKEDKKYDQIGAKIYSSLEKVTQICQELKPFSHPFYWASFTCTGVR